MSKNKWGFIIIWLGLITIALFFMGGRSILADAPSTWENNSAQNNIPTRLSIPSIKLDSKIRPVGVTAVMIKGQLYGEWEVAQNEVGWHNPSSYVGEAGNMVLAGHSNIYAQVFRNLEDIAIGDEIIVYTDEQPHYYSVSTKIEVQESNVPIEVRRKNGRWIAETDDERLTLVTCIKPGATHRLIVVARPLTAAYQNQDAIILSKEIAVIPNQIPEH